MVCSDFTAATTAAEQLGQSRRPEELGRDSARRRSGHGRSARPRRDEPEPLERASASASSAPRARPAERLVEPEAEHHALRGGVVRRAARPPAAAARRAERREVAAEARWFRQRRPPTVETAPMPSAEVVAAEPVGEVVPRAEVPPPAASGPGRSSPSRTSGSRRRSASRRRARSSPPSPRPGERAHPRAGMCEARPRLGLELVAGEVLGLEGERLVEVALESRRCSGPGSRR